MPLVLRKEGARSKKVEEIRGNIVLEVIVGNQGVQNSPALEPSQVISP